ncbi:uncharacterized protein LOC123531567 [Mercenaria mercenaria]|uniref:uncharacterized protein LOC123531567 n=1 Tax=Mercenaria mercenaria TaxID=6596 RepID=UPI001E1D9BB3|nr:uncharacterized protein LOC123531567 [Mercenaria mercenaria]XP_045168580.1 uncharacterized protein LOC123531567 [Mercenaria mercenaria]
MKLTREQIEEFWRNADKNQDGKLTVQEIQLAIKRYDQHMTDSAIAGIFCDIDTDNDDKITKREFVDQMSKSRADDLAQLWRKYDTDRSGELSRGEAIELIKAYFPADKCNSVIGKFLQFSDRDGNGVITKEEYDNFFCQ